MRKILFVFVWSNAALTQVKAQTDSLRTQTLNEVVVSASRFDQKILETPRSVTVINSDVIRNSVYNSVGDLLAKQPGIYIVGSNQTPGTNQSLFMRGSNSNQVVVMLDGVRITDPSTPNNAIDLSELSLTNVDRIEIIEGAHSTVYGGGAIGGVINIITKKNGSPGLHGSGSIQSGTFGQGTFTQTTNANLGYSYKNGWYLNGSFFDQHVTGLSAAIDTAKKQFLPPRKDGFRKTDSYLKAGYRQDGWDGFVSYKSTVQHADIDAGAFTPANNDYVNFMRNQLNYSLAYQISSKLKLTGNGSWSHSRRINENDSSKISQTRYDGNYFKGVYEGRLNTNELQLNYRTENVTGITGGGAYQERMNFNTFTYTSPSSEYGSYSSTTNYDSLPVRATTWYGFAQASWHGGPKKKLGFSAGARLSNHSLFGNFLTYDVNPSFALSTSSLIYGSASSGYNAPSLYELFDPTLSFGAYTNLGNRSLKPEKSLSYELGYKKEFNSGSYFTTSLFQTATSHLIDFVYLWNKATAIQSLSYSDYLGDTYLNLSHQQVSGVEFSGRWIATNALSLGGNMTWLQGKITYNQSDLDNTKTGGNHVQLYSNGAFVTGEGTINSLARRPKVTAFAELKYQIEPAVSISFYYRLAGRRQDSFYDPTLGPFGALNQQPVATYHLFDAGVYYRLKRWISFTAKVENIFNVQYQEILGYNTRGRSAYLRVNFTW
jgi:vitamin B12 transporter